MFENLIYPNGEHDYDTPSKTLRCKRGTTIVTKEYIFSDSSTTYENITPFGNLNNRCFIQHSRKDSLNPLEKKCLDGSSLSSVLTIIWLGAITSSGIWAYIATH